MLSEARKKLREGRVTASIVPAILGSDPYKSPRQAWQEITGRLSDEAGEAALLGSCFEAGILDYFERATGEKIVRRNVRRVGLDSLLAATLDAHTATHVVEAKSSWAPFPVADEWGEPGTDEVPEKVVLQTAAQMLCAEELQGAHVPRLHAGGKLCGIYTVHRDARLLGLVAEGVRKFTRDYIETDRPPPPDHRDEEALRGVERRSGVTARVPGDLVLRMAAAKRAEKLAKAESGTVHALILDALKVGDSFADRGESDEGPISFLKCKDGTKFDAAAFAAAHPDLFAKYQIPKPGHRTLRGPWSKLAGEGGAA